MPLPLYLLAVAVFAMGTSEFMLAGLVPPRRVLVPRSGDPVDAGGGGAPGRAPVPSSLWRLPLMFGVPMGMDQTFMDDMMSHPLWMRASYLLALGVISDGAAFLTLGLVRSWGEIWPRWLPVVGGRRVHPLAAMVPATLGGLLVTAITVVMAVGWDANMTNGYNGWEIFQTAMYAPLILWGPLLLVVTAHYARRRGLR